MCATSSVSGGGGADQPAFPPGLDTYSHRTGVPDREPPCGDGDMMQNGGFHVHSGVAGLSCTLSHDGADMQGRKTTGRPSECCKQSTKCVHFQTQLLYPLQMGLRPRLNESLITLRISFFGVQNGQTLSHNLVL